VQRPPSFPRQGKHTQPARWSNAGPMKQANGDRRHPLPGAALAALLVLAAAGAAGQSCNFRNPPPGDILFSPALDPSIASTRVATSSMRVQCSAGTSPAWSFSGINGNAPLRLKHATQNAFISYSVSPAFTGGPSSNQQWTVTATILGADYVNAPPGTYSDALTATILP
jgi:hypothetical protein